LYAVEVGAAHGAPQLSFSDTPPKNVFPYFPFSRCLNLPGVNIGLVYFCATWAWRTDKRCELEMSRHINIDLAHKQTHVYRSLQWE